MAASYSVLMSVYQKEKPDYLRAALTSIINQTLPADEIVLVCDGPLTQKLDQVIDDFLPKLKVVRLPENRGLGAALSEGLKHCRNSLVARMDTDDLAVRDRCRRQVSYLEKHSEVDVLSGTLAEFEGEALTVREAKAHVLSHKKLPVSDQEIRRYIKYRNPVNHPCVMFRKEKAAAAGGYRPCDLFEDYDLWARMYRKHCVFANLPETILYMRVNEMHARRGGFRYVKANWFFWNRMYRRKLLTLPQYLFVLTARSAVSLMPNWMRKIIYKVRLRNH